MRKGKLNMKKALMFTISAIFTFILVSCVEVAVKDVTSIELSWQPEEAYLVGDNVNLSNRSVIVNFEDGTDKTLTFGDTSLTIRGDIDDTSLVTNTPGEKNIKISYGGVTVDIYYYVANIIVEQEDNINTKLSDATAGQHAYVTSGEYSVTSEISLTAADVTITGPKYAEAKITSNDNVTIFFIKNTNITIKHLTLTTTFVAPNTSYTGENYPDGVTFQEENPGLIVVGADGAHINDNILFGTYSANYNYTQMTTFGIKPSDNGVGTITVERNTIYNLRQAIQLGKNNIGIVKDNIMFHTKGGILSYNKTYDQWISDDWTGNSWESTVAGYEDGNEADIVFHGSDQVPDNNSGEKTWHTFAQILTLSALNNNGSVTDRRMNPTDPEFIESDGTRFNRTHVYIREITPAFVANNPFYEPSQPTIAGQKGNIRLPLWDTDINQSVRIALGLTGVEDEALVEGGTIMVWNEAMSVYEVYPPSNYPFE
jgi:hypothetical protein